MAHNEDSLFQAHEKIGEPWVFLPDDEAIVNWGRDEEISYNQVNRQLKKANFY